MESTGYFSWKVPVIPHGKYQLFFMENIGYSSCKVPVNLFQF